MMAYYGFIHFMYLHTFILYIPSAIKTETSYSKFCNDVKKLFVDRAEHLTM